MTGTELASGLRAWAAGMYETEAAVELVLRACGGRLADKGWPWVERTQSEGFRLDPDAMTECDGLSGGERRVLAVVQALITAGPLWHVGGILNGLDRVSLTLVLAAFAHAAGSHEQAEAAVPGDWLSLRMVGPVVPWPEEAAA